MVQPRRPLVSPTAWITIQNGFTQVFGAVLFAVQAPLLGPKAFGLVTLVMIFIGFCESVLEIATTDALLSVRNIDARHYSTVTAFNAGLSSLLGVGVFLFAEPIAGIFKEPDLAPVLRWMSVLPLVTSLISAPNAATRREMQFGPLAVRSLISAVAGGAVGITLALLHYGVWALVLQAIVQRLLNVVILWLIVPIRFSLAFSVSHFRELRQYAAPMLLTQGMSWGGGQIPRFVLGLYLGASDLGLFSLASRLTEIMLQLTVSPRYGVARVELRRHADDPPGMLAAVERLLMQMGFLCFPVCLGGAAVMPTLFAAWLDARWAPGVFAAQAMLLGAVGYVTHYALSAAWLAVNRQSFTAINSTVQAVATVVLVAVSAPFGLNPATAAFAAKTVVTMPVPLHYSRRYCAIPAAKVLAAQAPVLACAAGMGAVVVALRLALNAHLDSRVLLLILVSVGAATYGVLLLRFCPEAAAPLRTLVVDRISRRRNGA